MAKKTEQPAYWAVIPADVRYDEQIPPNAKLLYGEISALCNQAGYCWATNDYFAQLFGWSSKSVTRLVSALREQGYIDVDMMATKDGAQRRIYAGVYPGGLRNFAEEGVRKIVRGVSAKLSTPHIIDKNNACNNTPLTPQGGKCVQKRVHKDAPDWKPERFAGLWSYYPRKGRKNKQRAIAAWDKLRPDDALIDQIARSLARLKATEEWQRDIGIPHVATFLNGERWHDADELDPPDGAGTEEVTFGWEQ